jgi:hypothetical protein
MWHLELKKLYLVFWTTNKNISKQKFKTLRKTIRITQKHRITF